MISGVYVLSIEKSILNYVEAQVYRLSNEIPVLKRRQARSHLVELF